MSFRQELIAFGLIEATSFEQHRDARSYCRYLIRALTVRSRISYAK